MMSMPIPTPTIARPSCVYIPTTIKNAQKAREPVITILMPAILSSHYSRQKALRNYVISGSELSILSRSINQMGGVGQLGRFAINVEWMKSKD